MRMVMGTDWSKIPLMESRLQARSGKEHGAAYVRGVNELEERLLLPGGKQPFLLTAVACKSVQDIACHAGQVRAY